jgi:predicted AAA+ superfamily ATPase
LKALKYSGIDAILMAPSIFELAQNNPWWANPAAIDSDLHVKSVEQSAVKWMPGLRKYMPLDSADYVFYTIRGPRQVGKTTFIKLMIRDLLRSGISPNQVFFWPCDQIRNERDMTQLLETYINFSRSNTRSHQSPIGRIQ